MIKLEKVSKIFHSGGKEIPAVQDVTLDIQEGEIFGIIGFSGAGKSTLVRCINLLEKPTAGRVTIDGVELTGLDEKKLREVRRKIGMIFQHFNLLRSRTVYQNIAFPLRKSSLSKVEKDFHYICNNRVCLCHNSTNSTYKLWCIISISALTSETDS